MNRAKTVLVGLKTREQAGELTELACRAAAPGAKVYLAHVVELPDVTPLDAEVPDLDRAGKNILHAAERVARRCRTKPILRLLRAHKAGPALVEECKEWKVDLAVLSYHHDRTLGELIFGTTAQHLARHAPCRLLLSIPPRT